MNGTRHADRLATAPVEVIGRFAEASNATLLVRFTDREQPPLPDPFDLDAVDPDDLAVYKPQRGEAPLWDFPEGTLHRREVAAHVVNDLLGWDLVPLTVLREDAPLGPGSMQAYVPHDRELHWFTLRDHPDPRVQRQLRALVLFDLLCNNTDRKGGHVLLDERADPPRIRAIDHGVCFHVDPKVRTVAWDFATEAVPPELTADIAGLVDHLTPGGTGRARLSGLLAADELDHLVRRATAVSQLASLPEPSGPHPFPWPLL